MEDSTPAIAWLQRFAQGSMAYPPHRNQQSQAGHEAAASSRIPSPMDSRRIGGNGRVSPQTQTASSHAHVGNNGRGGGGGGGDSSRSINGSGGTRTPDSEEGGGDSWINNLDLDQPSIASGLHNIFSDVRNGIRQRESASEFEQ